MLLPHLIKEDSVYNKRRPSQKPQLGTIQRSPDHGKLYPKGYMYITVSASVVQRTWKKRRPEDCKNQDNRKCAANQSFQKCLHKQDWSNGDIN